MDNEIKQALVNLLASPKSYAIDGESVQMQSPDDLKKLIKLLSESEKDGQNALKRCGFFRVSTEQAGR